MGGPQIELDYEVDDRDGAYVQCVKVQANNVNCCMRGNGICPTPGVS